VYAIVYMTSLWLAGFLYARVLPMIQQYQPKVSLFQFVFSHVFLFSFYPALATAFLYAHWYKHRIAYFVWAIPLAILAVKFFTFPTTTSVLAGSSSHLAAAFHQYFGGDFLIGGFRTYGEMFEMAASNPDMARGMEQHNFTAPFYAAIGYAIGTSLGINFPARRFEAALEYMKPTASSVE
jgi:hypothetical protein